MGVRPHEGVGLAGASVRQCVSASVRQCVSASVRQCVSASVRQCVSASVRQLIARWLMNQSKLFLEEDVATSPTLASLERAYVGRANKNPLLRRSFGGLAWWPR